MTNYDPDKTVQDDYTGELTEPKEDRSILQPDGSRACYNWECAGKGFAIDNIVNQREDLLETDLREQLNEFGISQSVNTVEDLLTQIENGLNLDEKSFTDIYFKLENAEETRNNPDKDFIIRKYNLLTDENAVLELRQNLSSAIVNPERDLTIFPRGISCLVAEIENQVVGYIVYEDIGNLRIRHEAVVDQKYRQKGIHKCFSTAIEEAGFLLESLVMKDNLAALTSLFKQGYEISNQTSSGYFVLTKDLR